MAADDETFLARWSRLKREQAAQETDKPVVKDETPPPPLPPVDKLTPESDFSVFMHPKVEDALRRTALKKLFGDPHFNLPDPYEPYSGDWTGGEAIPAAMLKELYQGKKLLFQDEEKKEAQQEEKPPAEETPKEDDGAGRQDA